MFKMLISFSGATLRIGEWQQLFAVAALLSLAGCSGSSPPPSSIDIGDTPWAKLPDGSSITRSWMHSSDLRTDAMERCWPRKDQTFDCINLLENEVSGFKSFEAYRSLRADLKDKISSTDSPRDGYVCADNVGGPAEIIRRRGKDLITHHWKNDAAWTRAYVRQFQAANEVIGEHGWFNCLNVQRLKLDGSLDTFTTTIATRSKVLGSDK